LVESISMLCQVSFALQWMIAADPLYRPFLAFHLFPCQILLLQT
jgi:hypothetical protein